MVAHSLVNLNLSRNGLAHGSRPPRTPRPLRALTGTGYGRASGPGRLRPSLMPFAVSGTLKSTPIYCRLAVFYCRLAVFYCRLAVPAPARALCLDASVN